MCIWQCLWECCVCVLQKRKWVGDDDEPESESQIAKEVKELEAEIARLKEKGKVKEQILEEISMLASGGSSRKVCGRQEG